MNRLSPMRGYGLAILGLTATHPASAQEGPPSAIEARNTQVPATPVAAPYPDAAAGDGNTQQGYNPLRWAEDWRRMRDPAKRDDLLDRLKYIPIGSDDVYLTLSGELRARVNYFSNPQGRKAEHQRQDSYRIFLGADLHLGEHFRAYGELARGPMDGKNIGSPSGTLSNGLLLQQAFVDGTARVGQIDVGARVGRQVFIDGSNLLLANRDNNTVQTSLTGVRTWARGSRLRADAFDLYYTTYGNGGIGDDPVDWGRRFSGITTGIVLPKQLFGGSKLYFDPFVWRLRNRAVAWGTETAREERVYVGAHLWGEAGPVTIDWTANHQGGRYGDRELDAWQVLLAGTYRLGKANNAPRLGLHVDYATGGGAYDRGKLKNAFAPYGNNIYYSYQGFLTPTNLIALAPSLTVLPTKSLRVTGEYQFTWRETTDDAVYRANGTPFTGTAGAGGRRTVDVARLQAIWTVSPRLSLTGRLEHGFARNGLKTAGYRDSSYAALWASFRF
ncbi:alginate export family protein [Sphingomonas sp. CFBP 8760]|uniref:alginate export family protein n=1 Tax=Sphingomonas sp. CFBP 8760 TaxID=2775282 RepID=UPI001FCEF4F7|nr:alginate export family protein [Sphingomonas sp. CFBP 8760]